MHENSNKKFMHISEYMNTFNYIFIDIFDA
jgi:hypothetical protein